MDDVRVFPSLGWSVISLTRLLNVTHSWESTIVPEVALVREAVANESELALLDVLFDRIQELVFGDLP